MHKIHLRDERSENYRYVNINGVLTEHKSGTEQRTLTVQLVAGEGGVPERIQYYDSDRFFVPQLLRTSWSRKPGEQEWKQSGTELRGQGFAKDGKTPLKGRGRGRDGTLGHLWPLAAGDQDKPKPAWMNWQWLRDLIDPHDPSWGWPQ